MADQTQSRLLSLPPELRREILLHALPPIPGLHLYLQDGRPRVSPCLGANLGEEAFNDRAAYGPIGALLKGGKIEEWARRVSSPWANHWMCEEVRDGKRFADHPVERQEGYTFALLVCKQMLVECTGIIAEKLQLTVTDLEAAQFLVNLASTTPSPAPSCPFTEQALVPHAFLASTHSLNLSLYRDPEVYFALSLSVAMPEGSTPTALDNANPIARAIPQGCFWRRFCAGLTALSRLSHLTVWLDNTDDFWSDVDERAMLAPLLAAAKVLPRTRLAVHLPEIPRDEVRRARYLPVDPAPSVMVRRSNRRPTTTFDVEGGMEWTLSRSDLRMYSICMCRRVEEVL